MARVEAAERATYAEGLRLLTGGEPSADVVDALWAIGSHEVYLQLTQEADWSPQKYRSWLAGHVDQLTTLTRERPTNASHTPDDRDGPCDTRMMGVVDSALRRDLVRARLVLEGEAPLSDRRRVALAEHLIWLMDFLHEHHSSEDAGLYPMVLRNDPSTAALVAEMDADHQRIDPAMAALVSAAERWRDNATAAAAVAETLDRLGGRAHPAPEPRGDRDDAGGCDLRHPAGAQEVG